MTDRTSFRPTAAWLVLCVALVAATAMSCQSTSRRTSSSEIRAGSGGIETGSVLRVFATGDGRGHLEPCGCEKDQTGGLPRRGSYLQALRRDGDLVVDVGNLTSGKGQLRDARRTYSFDALVTLRYDAFVPGPAETFDGEAFIRAAAERPSVAVICANWSRADGTALFPPYLLRTAANGKRVAFIGVTEPFADEAKAYKISPAADAVRSVLRDLAGQVDAVVLGAAMSLPAAEELARGLVDVPAVSVILVGATAEDDSWKAPANAARLEIAGDLGSYVTRVDLGPSLSVRDAWKSWLDDRTAEDPAMTALVKAYRDTITGFDANYVEGLVQSHRGDGFAGSSSCVTCHVEECRAWRSSAHSHAMKILVEKKSSRDPDCVPCHLVDSRVANEVIAVDDMGVGCEACHGASAAHVLSAQAGSVTPAKTPQRDPKSTCAGCHHPPFVKVFAIDTHWPRIEHGRRAR